MPTTTEKAAAALELLPEEMREPAVAYLIEQAEKFRVLKEMLAEGPEDVRSRNGIFKIFCAGHAHDVSAPKLQNENFRYCKRRTTIC